MSQEYLYATIYSTLKYKFNLSKSKSISQNVCIIILHIFLYVLGIGLYLIMNPDVLLAAEDVDMPTHNVDMPPLNDYYHNKVSDDLGILLFNDYLSQDLQNNNPQFLRDLVCLDMRSYLTAFSNDPVGIRKVIKKFEAAFEFVKSDSNMTLKSIIQSVCERALIELKVDLLSIHSHED